MLQNKPGSDQGSISSNPPWLSPGQRGLDLSFSANQGTRVKGISQNDVSTRRPTWLGARPEKSKNPFKTTLLVKNMKKIGMDVIYRLTMRNKRFNNNIMMPAHRFFACLVHGIVKLIPLFNLVPLFQNQRYFHVECNARQTKRWQTPSNKTTPTTTTSSPNYLQRNRTRTRPLSRESQ